MLQSKLFAKIEKEPPEKEESKNASLLRRASFIHKEMSGVYTFLPLGLMVLRNIEKIIREEMKAISAEEILMSALQPKEIWQKTGRWDGRLGKEIMFKAKLANRELGLAPTHEEMVANLAKNFISSYTDLPVALFQIQSKFRMELRAKSGILRGREFGMKDLYSFHQNNEDFQNYYQTVKESYFKIFKRCGLEAIAAKASGGEFIREKTDEFQVLSESGEDTIIYCPNKDFAENTEISNFKEGDKCPVCGEKLKKGKSIEVGNIFPLGIKYSEALDLKFKDRDGKEKFVIMGSYGIGTTRLIGTIAEIYGKENEMLWPKEVSPFDVHIIGLGEKDKKLKSEAVKAYEILEKSGKTALYDDRLNKSAGEKFSDADLIGVPIRLIIGKKFKENGKIEIEDRVNNEKKLVKTKDLLKVI